MIDVKGYAEEDIQLALKRNDVELRIFVGGPYVDFKKKKAPEANINGGAPLLRYTVAKHIAGALKYDVTYGESKELQEIYKKHLGNRFAAATNELAHIHEFCHGIILIPSSPGSFCELGYFATSNAVCDKMLVLSDKNYARKRNSYIKQGPIKQAKLHHAKVVDVDYKDHPSVISVVDKFVEDIRSKEIEKEYRIK